MKPFYDHEELLEFGFGEVGENVRVSSKCSLYAISGRIGSNVRIDDFCILKGHIELGSYIHIGAFGLISGVCGAVRMMDCSTLSGRVSIYTGSDDYRASTLSSATVPDDYKTTIMGGVTIGVGAIVGAHSVILPNTQIGDGASIGALCIAQGTIESGAIITAQRGQRADWKRDVSEIRRLALKLREQEAHLV